MSELSDRLIQFAYDIGKCGELECAAMLEMASHEIDRRDAENEHLREVIKNWLPWYDPDSGREAVR